MRGDVMVTAVTDEEVAASARRRSSATGTPTPAIITEPTDERVCVAHKGFVGFEIETRGLAAHGSLPEVGIDAIATMGPLLVGIESSTGRSGPGTEHPLLKTGSLHASLIEGGQEFSTYPDRCRAERSGGRSRARPTRSSSSNFGRSSATLDADVSFPFAREPLETPPDAEIVSLVRRASGADEVHRRRVLGGLGAARGRRSPDRPLRPEGRRRARRRRVGRPRERGTMPWRLRRGGAGILLVSRRRVPCRRSR